MTDRKPLISYIKAYDIVIAAFYLLLTLYIFVFYDLIPQNNFFIAHNVFIILFTFFLAWCEQRFPNSKTFKLVHYWYIAPLILITFKELYYLIKPVRHQDFDWLFIKIDHWMFGFNPTQALFHISNPVLTEVLQIVYGMFYLLPIILCLALLKRKRYLAADYAVFSIIFGFYLSYVGYFALPGIGPRFTLHNFIDTDKELPGLLLTQPLRDFTNNGESISSSDPQAADKVQRDVFPSGHTMLTLITMYLSIKFKSRSRFFLVPVGLLLIFSTVYLRYHYVVDLIGGAIFMMISLGTGRYVFNWWQQRQGKEMFYWGSKLLEDERISANEG